MKSLDKFLLFIFTVFFSSSAGFTLIGISRPDISLSNTYLCSLAFGILICSSIIWGSWLAQELNEAPKNQKGDK